MKILITGGHFSPALSVIQALPKDTDVLVVGRKHSFEGDDAFSYEYTVTQKLGIPFKTITTGRLQRKLTGTTLSSIAKLPVGLAQAHAIMRHFKPDVVFTCGGYIALPIAFAAKLTGIPIVVHEQTQHAGLANKIIGKFAHTVCISFESSRQYFKSSTCTLTGNPIRSEVFEEGKPLMVLDQKKLIYITGGSAGSHFINDCVQKVLPQLLASYSVIHQTGRSTEYKDFESLEEYKKSLPEELSNNYLVRDFIYPDEIGWILKNASLVVSRAGINTVTELLALGTISFLIPLPHGQQDEQLENAKLIQKVGIGEFAEQKDLNAQTFLEKIQAMFEKYSQYAQHIPEAKKLASVNADKHIASIIQSIYETKKSTKKKQAF
jgi:UDP-N-acetylglucosamine--N-acetylmuramyl-(pentapeptide) pyrophosphoryl-undecaprenol N-acetylglucosamine transferase